MGFIVRIIVNSIALYIATRFVPGFIVDSGIMNFLLGGLVLGLLNSLVKPVLKLISFPIIILTLGLFLIVINAIIIWLLDALLNFVTIDGIVSLLLGTLIIAIINHVLYSFTD